MDAWSKMFDAAMYLDSSIKEILYLPMTGVMYVLVGQDCPDHTDHNDFEGRESLIVGFFAFVFRLEAICLLVCPTSLSYMRYSISVNKKLVEKQRVKEVAILAYCVFVVH